MFGFGGQKQPAPGTKQYQSVIVFDTKGTVSGMLGDPVGREIKKWGEKGWLLEKDELVTKGNLFAAARRRLTFSKGSAPVAQVNPAPVQTTVINQASAGDEIAKLAELKNQGILTQEEFDAKKKQILGI